MINTREQLRCGRKGCRYTTNRSYNLERHERNHEKGKVPVSQCQPCPHCTYAAGSLHNLMRHINNKHAMLSVNKQKEQLPCSQAGLHKKLASTEQSRLEEREREEYQEENPAQQLFTFDNERLRPSHWHWSTLQQQEKNFFRRSALNAECTILERTVNMFKLYLLVKARGGALNVDDWDNVAAALGLPQESGRHVHAKYMDVLIQYEKNEEERLQKCRKVEGVPFWWDDGDFIMDSECCTLEDSWWPNEECPSLNVQNAIVEMILNKYYLNHLKNSEPFKRFHVKDSWLWATMLNYQALISQMNFKHYTDS
ncbi:uncharacterized protein LOC117790438 [Drosophila innubila]|uniref:uncharacterized protein LOC117790438 n=1 Tax=Drosophila innubila TaxID=198719 RepID=UPI00148B4E12|nr:uncharacterized protein LOC117790438 [Drosophila innubila]